MDLSERLKSLLGLNKPALCQLWSELFKERIPLGVRRELLVRILAYRLQEQAFGGLSPATRRRLREMAAQIESRKAKRYVAQVLHAAFLAPDIVEAILNGQQPVDLTIEKLRKRPPIDWQEQRTRLCRTRGS
jgi:hypothetical protein